MKLLNNAQRGMSFTGFIFGGFLLIVVAIFAMKLIPAYLHSSQISQIFREIASDTSLRGASVGDIEMSYRKRASVNDITDLNVDDISIENENGNLVLSAHYFVKVPLAGNVTLLLEFNPSSK
jgi:hypothetical protein